MAEEKIKLLIQSIAISCTVKKEGNQSSLVLDNGEPTPIDEPEVRELEAGLTFEGNFNNLTKEISIFNKNKKALVNTYPAGEYKLIQKRIIKPKND